MNVNPRRRTPSRECFSPENYVCGLFDGAFENFRARWEFASYVDVCCAGIKRINRKSKFLRAVGADLREM